MKHAPSPPGPGVAPPRANIPRQQPTQVTNANPFQRISRPTRVSPQQTVPRPTAGSVGAVVRQPQPGQAAQPTVGGAGPVIRQPQPTQPVSDPAPPPAQAGSGVTGYGLFNWSGVPAQTAPTPTPTPTENYNPQPGQGGITQGSGNPYIDWSGGGTNRADINLPPTGGVTGVADSGVVFNAPNTGGAADLANTNISQPISDNSENALADMTAEGDAWIRNWASENGLSAEWTELLVQTINQDGGGGEALQNAADTAANIDAPSSPGEYLSEVNPSSPLTMLLSLFGAGGALNAENGAAMAAAGQGSADFFSAMIGGLVGQAGQIYGTANNAWNDQNAPPGGAMGTIQEMLDAQGGYDQTTLNQGVSANMQSMMNPAAWEQMAQNRELNLQQDLRANTNDMARRMRDAGARGGYSADAGLANIYGGYGIEMARGKRDIFNDILGKQMGAAQMAGQYGLGDQGQRNAWDMQQTGMLGQAGMLDSANEWENWTSFSDILNNIAGLVGGVAQGAGPIAGALIGGG